MADRRRVVITGMGVATPVGLAVDTVWQNVLAGKSGIAPIRSFDVEGRSGRNGAEIDQEALNAELDRLGFKSQDRTVDMALVAAGQALAAAGLLDDEQKCSVPGVAALIGSGNGPSVTVEGAFKYYYESGFQGIRPTAIVRGMNSIVSSQLSLRYRLTGANYMVSSACASSANALGIAFRMVRDGYADLVLTGGAESFFTHGLYSAWDRLGVMSKETDPDRACRPFDIDRDGFVMGEGATMMVIESMDRARSRGAKAGIELLGYGESSDAYHMTRPTVEGQTSAMKAAIADAGIEPSQIGFINAHGTATKANDACESKSIREVLGDHADNTPVTANKSFFGHSLGAAGAIETVLTALSLEKGLITPNRNLDNPDPDCRLRFVGTEPEPTDAVIAMKNGFGFGGNNAVLLIGKSRD